MSTSKRTELTIRSHAADDPPAVTREQGTLTRRDGDLRIRTDSASYWISAEKLIVYKKYALTLDPKRETVLEYPTPYGTLHMTVRTKRYKADHGRVAASYDLLTEGKVAESINIELTFTEE